MDQGWGGVGSNSGFGHVDLKCVRDIHMGIKEAIRMDSGESSGQASLCPHRASGKKGAWNEKSNSML